MKKLLLLLAVTASFFIQSCSKDDSNTETPISNVDAPIFGVITTKEITDKSANISSNVSITGTEPITSKGLVWATSADPTIVNFKIETGSGAGVIESVLNSLLPNTKYYVRAYAINNKGTFYSNQLTFNTLSGVNAPVFGVITTKEITDKSANISSNVSITGTEPITSKGLVWGTSADPTIVNFKIETGSGAGAIESVLSSLLPNTKYYVKAYAIDKNGTYYSDQITFTTLPETLKKYGMTAKINGEYYQMNNIFGKNEATKFLMEFHDDKFIRLQGVVGGFLFGKEINIFIERAKLEVGTYKIGYETDYGKGTHADLTDSTSWESDHSISGSVTITFVDKVNKIVKGTFNFNSSSEWTGAPVNNTITEGTFDYYYYDYIAE